MRNSITGRTYKTLEREWSRKVQQEYEGLNSAEDIIAFLKDPHHTVTFRHALCRFIREYYGKKSEARPGFTSVELCGLCVEFSNSDDSPLLEEIDDYVAIMMELAKKRGMKDQIQSKLLRRYLTGKQEAVSRDTLFKMAFAFGMDSEYVCELLEVLDEIPYNFRRAEECIYYFCHYSEEYNDWDTAQELISWYYSGESGEQSDFDMREGQSKLIEGHIAMLLNDIDDPDERKNALMRYLDIHRSELRGYSMTSYRIADELMDELKDLTCASDDIELSIRLWEPIWMQYYTKKADRTGINRSDFIPWKNILDLPKLVYEKPLWRARIQKLRKRKVPVEKRDILFLNCMKWSLDKESEGGADAMHEFILETNDLLLECGLSVIYPPNSYDRMILLAVCSDSPYDVLSDIFKAATDEEKLSEQIRLKG